MFKTKGSFVGLLIFISLMGCYSFAGDLILIVKKSMEERTSDLERKCAMYDAWFKENNINLEQKYGNKIVIIKEGEDTRHTNTTIILGGVKNPTNPREAGRYIVMLKNGNQFPAITFEQITSSNKTDYYNFVLENGTKIKYTCKSVESINFINWTKRGE